MIEYIWYKLLPYSTAVGEKYDDTKDEDLLMLCRNIPDILFLIFKLQSSGMTIAMRVPKIYQSMMESIQSFGIVHNEYPLVTKLDAYVTLKLAKNYVYPLVPDIKLSSDVYSIISDAPCGVFGIKLGHAPSKHVTRRYKSLLKKSKKAQDTVHVDPYEKFAKQKAESTSFYYAEIFYGVKKISDIEPFEKTIPYTSDTLEPNHLITSRVFTARQKNLDAATKILQKTVKSKPKSRKTILSEQDIRPFVKFPEQPHILGLDTAASPVMSSGDQSDGTLFPHLDKYDQ